MAMANPKRILIADDEDDLTWAISKSLSKTDHDFEIESVGNGNDAWQRLSEKNFDLLISDIRMPGRSGLQLLLDIRKSYPETKVVIITAYGSREIIELTEKYGSFFYLEKPFELGYLKQIVLDALGIKKQGFNGSIQSARIHELVTMNCTNKSNSSLVISAKERKGTIHFRNGDIVHAEYGKLRGEKAFFNILNLAHGTFKIHHKKSAIPRTILRDWKTLLHHYY